LQNIASSVIAPFPYLGFQKAINFIESEKEKNKKSENHKKT
jgi:hypothetical protein